MSRTTARDRVGDFDENSPRPPVPGEETGPCCLEYPPIFSPTQNLYRCTPRVPVSSSVHSAALLEGKAPLGFEPEGRCSNDHGSCSPFNEGTRSPPPYLQWAKNLFCLLEDGEGVTLFKRYLERQGKVHADALDFWFACEGLKKKTNNQEFVQYAKAIWKWYKPVLHIKEELRSEVTSRLRGHRMIYRGVFDDVQAEVADRIKTTTYPNFLESDIYIDYVRRMQQDPCSSYDSSSGSSSSSTGRELALCGGQSFLPTLHEDEVLDVMPEPLPLTKDSLVATETRRIMDLRPKPEAYAGIYLQHGAAINTKVYSSYNPVSRQDSELQSLSSDARTESDSMSCTENSVDGNGCHHYQRAKIRQQQKQLRAIRESASINRDTMECVIPRTQRMCMQRPLAEREFVEILAKKMEAAKKEIEEDERIGRGRRFKFLEEEKATLSCADKPKQFADLLHDKFICYEDQDNDQAILDEHCQRVWSDDFTPCRSPPDARKKMVAQSIPNPYQVKATYPAKYTKKEKDVYSTFSADSGNVHDFPDNSECGRQFPKSRSFPEHVDTQNTMSSFEGRHRSAKDNGFRRLNNNKKTQSTELTDSGVSVISDTIPCSSSKHGNEWQMSRMKESSDRTGSKHRSLKQPSTLSSSSSFPHRHGRKSERSGSLERSVQGMHLSDQTVQMAAGRPNTASQLEEARRKLEDDTQRKLFRQRVTSGVTSSKAQTQSQMPDLSLSNQSTLRKSVKRSEPSPPLQQQQRPIDEFMTVTYSFWDEDVPYRTKVAGKEVTLKQFKDLLPRKGNYRYFFKTDCQEVESKAIHEEVFDENQILPLWEGKLIAQVKPQN